MNRTRAFFLEEATECLAAARAELERETPDLAVVHRAVRRLRGTAQVARFTGIATRSASLEGRLRDAPGAAGWPPDVRRATAETLRWLESALAEVRSGEVEPEIQGDEQMDGEAREEGDVGIEDLEYHGRAALERAMQLREVIEEATMTGASVAPLLDELFDLIRLGMR